MVRRPHQGFAGLARRQYSQGAAGHPLSQGRLYHGGRHAFLAWPDRQWPQRRDEPWLGKLGRALCLSQALWRAASNLVARWTAGLWRQFARRSDRPRRPQGVIRPGDNLALARCLPERFRGPDRLVDETTCRGQSSSPRGSQQAHRPRPADNRGARRRGDHARCLGQQRSRQGPDPALPLVRLSRSRRGERTAGDHLRQAGHPVLHPGRPNGRARIEGGSPCTLP